ncbi:hypothetical protein [Pantoea sp. AMG 501]|uniref:hypothetical protein n=1 Tax=Pantoea sp. AMG 501 TaxID=2008894 RepID=UPI000B5A833C|nr:hypothetical protein [Pantoea sp. AMG 501]OWY74468.1 hypothetical protein CDN97_23450 [Pantoea sp. AMG 501]
MKKVHTRQIAAATMAGGMIIMAAGVAHADGTGEASTEFTVGIDVHDSDTCTLTVSPPAVRAFSFNWHKKAEGKAGEGDKRMSITKLGEAPLISVVASGGDACSVNGVKLITRAGDGASGVPDLPGQPTMTKSFGSKKGMWSSRPLLSKINLYTSADKSEAAVDKISVKTATGGTFTQGDKVAFDADWWGGQTANLGMNRVVLPAPQWFSEKAQPALLGADAAEGTLTWSTDKADAVYRAVEFGINVMVASDPIDSAGNASLDVATDGDSISVPFTLTVSQS